MAAWDTSRRSLLRSSAAARERSARVSVRASERASERGERARVRGPPRRLVRLAAALAAPGSAAGPLGRVRLPRGESVREEPALPDALPIGQVRGEGAWRGPAPPLSPLSLPSTQTGGAVGTTRRHSTTTRMSTTKSATPSVFWSRFVTGTAVGKQIAMRNKTSTAHH